ncbi:MAG: PEP/pyruvate-binding domain-containing protein, partial [Candidatus Competibacter sp.]|nr:PEP/pyruvate-binding domain-containing protein [Candidatus Competibacter sp.]
IYESKGREEGLATLKGLDIKVKIAMALEEHYALSQDIEFGITNGKVSILQTRPITMRKIGDGLQLSQFSLGK